MICETRSTRRDRRTRGSARVAAACLSVATFGAGLAHAGDYRLERIASGLTQPNYITQAPGDPSNVVYYVERTQAPTDGSYNVSNFSKVNHMGKVIRYDMSTGAKTTVLDLYDRKVFQDDGLQHVSFAPDFQTTGKIYVTSSTYTGTQAFGSNGSGTQPVPTNRVEEYTVNTANPSAATTTLSRTILSYTNNVQNNHTIDGAWFDPTATGAARNYLYISTGDSSFGNAYNAGGTGTNARPSQNPATIKGKILRVDVSGGDAYPTDANKNFAIPTDNPLPAYNVSHPAAQISGLGEVYNTGMRNAYRISFDRANGDLYMGDVGENLIEEVDFQKAGTNTGVNAPPADFGWPQLEGTQNSPVSGAPHTNVNPFTNATSVNPIQQFPHSGGSAVVGGYTYRGPIAELQGKYFYSDFVPGTVRMLAAFDRNGDPSTFNGNNGVVIDMTSTLNGLVFDRNDANYTSALAGAPFGLDHIVSYGEDNAGNVYIVDFGGTGGDGGFGNTTGEYPGDGLGEIFKLVLNGDVNRDNVRNAADIDLTLRAAPVGAAPPASRLYDYNNDGYVSPQEDTSGSDTDYLVRTLMHTEYGDADTNKSVDFADLLTLARNYGASGPTIGWANGDFTGDSAVTFEDLLKLAKHYGFGTAAAPADAVALESLDPSFQTDWKLAQALAPEPATVTATLGVLLPTMARRRRSH